MTLTALGQLRVGKKVRFDVMTLMSGCKGNVTVPRRGPATSERMGWKPKHDVMPELFR